MTTIVDLHVFPLSGFGCRRDLHFAVDGFFTAKDVLDELAPGAVYDQLGLPMPGTDRSIRDVVRDAMPAGWACIPFASASDGGGFPHASCAEHFRGAGRPPAPRASQVEGPWRVEYPTLPA